MSSFDTAQRHVLLYNLSLEPKVMGISSCALWTEFRELNLLQIPDLDYVALFLATVVLVIERGNARDIRREQDSQNQHVRWASVMIQEALAARLSVGLGVCRHVPPTTSFEWHTGNLPRLVLNEVCLVAFAGMQLKYVRKFVPIPDDRIISI